MQRVRRVLNADVSARLDGYAAGDIYNRGHIRITGMIAGRIVENSGHIEVSVGTLLRRNGRIYEYTYDGTLPAPKGLEASTSTGISEAEIMARVLGRRAWQQWPGNGQRVLARTVVPVSSWQMCRSWLSSRAQ